MKLIVKGLLIVIFFGVYFWILTSLIECIFGGFDMMIIIIISAIIFVVSAVLSILTTNKVIEIIKGS